MKSPTLPFRELSKATPPPKHVNAHIRVSESAKRYEMRDGNKLPHGSKHTALKQ